MKLRPLTGILLAAGSGRRFDPSGHQDKLLQTLPDGQPVALQSALRLQQAVERLCIVVDAGNTRLAERFRQADLPVLLCPDAADGMASSLKCALQATQDSAGWIVALADMPWVSVATLQALAAALRDGAEAVAPFYQGQRGNPVGFSAACRAQLMTLQGDQGARHLLAGFRLTALETGDSGILRDVDYPQDLL